MSKATCDVCREGTCPQAEPAPREGLRRYAHQEPPVGARFDHCPDEDPNDGPGDPCRGCPGYGYECGAWWVPA